MKQDSNAKLLHDFLQMTDHIAPQKFLAHTAMLSAKDAQAQVAVQMQALRDQQAELTLQLTKQHFAASMVEQQHEQQARDYEQQIRQQKTVHERLLSDHLKLKQEFEKQKAGMQQLSAQYKLLLDRDANR